MELLSRQERAEILQNLLLSVATGGEASDEEYRALRQELLANPATRPLLPRFVVSSRDLGQFWSFIKHKLPTYQARREFVWEEFRPLIDALEGVPTAAAPADTEIADALASLDEEHVRRAWAKALERRRDDPEGAVTAARTLLETVCKHILDEAGQPYEERDDLPKLYRRVAEHLLLAPDQHQEELFKQILGGCMSVVNGLGALRNKLSDAHGKGRGAAKPAERHAALAVNLSGSVSAFLVATWQSRADRASGLG